MNKFFKYILSAAAVMLMAGGLTSCINDLDVEPIDPALQSDVTAEEIFNKCYSVFATSGHNGGDDAKDIDKISDAGFTHLYRQMWNSNELTTDEALCSWSDGGINDFNYNTFDAGHSMMVGYYYRLCLGITFCNQYLDKFAGHDATMTAEIRFLRAFQYYLLTDAFGNVPFSDTFTGDAPGQYTRTQVCEFIEKELKAITGEEASDNVLNDPSPKKYGQAGYGRVDKAAAWMLLARLYLNSEVYTGTPRWQEAADYAKKVMDSPYKLHTQGYAGNGIDGVYREFTAYQMLFMGDNSTTDAAYEALFPVIQDGLRTTSWGGTEFLIASTVDDAVRPYRYDESEVNGLYDNNAWAGNRARPELVRLFFPNDDAPEAHAYDVYEVAEDDRALFETMGHTLDITDPANFKFGFAVAKFNNFKCDGSKGSSITFPDTHLFYMRVAEAYLTYAEALTRMSGGVAPAEAVNAINAIRGRAHALQRNRFTLDQILDEWGREFFFEGRRRVDLIRFNKFGGDTGYQWQWKGGVYAGRDFPAYRNVFAIPTDDLIANPNLTQNPGY